MSSDRCYLCASDEGILLDIFANGGKAHCGKIETCLSVKLQKSDAASSKICHKCAYELDACSKFVQKYRQTRDARRTKSKHSRKLCALCGETGVKGHIFELNEGVSLRHSLRKIREIFADSFFKEHTESLSICLDCRYNLDVLFDLKRVHRTRLDKLSEANEQASETTEYPKTKTSVVRRKTTYIPLPQLNSDKAYETDGSTTTSAMPMRRKRGRPRKESESVANFRICEQCNASIENGIDMYRYHRTGRTVCKDCWLTMDPEKVATDKRRKLGLVLKDVLANPAKYKTIYKVEKDEHGNTTFLITDDSSESEEKEKAPAKRPRRSQRSVASPIAEEAMPIIPEKKRPVKRVASVKSSEPEYEPPAKVTIRGRKKLEDAPSTSAETKSGNGVFTSDSEVIVRRTRGNSSTSSKKSPKAASLSDVDTSKSLPRKIGRLRKNPVVPPVSPPKIATSTTRGRRAAQKVVAPVNKSEDVARPLRRTRANSLTYQETAPLANRVAESPIGDAKTLSESVSSSSKIRNYKTKSLSPKNAKSDTETELYSCGVCKIEYKNKLIGMAHELSHAKQPEVKLQRVAIPEIIVEEAPAEISLINEPEQQSRDVSSTSDHRTIDDEGAEKPDIEILMENVPINVDTNVDEKNDKTEDSEVTIVDDKIVEDQIAEATNVDNVESNEANENEDKTEAPIVREPEPSEENKEDHETIVEEINSESNVEKIDCESNVEKIDCESNADGNDDETDTNEIDGAETTKEASPVPESMRNGDERLKDTTEETENESMPGEIVAPTETKQDNAECIEEPRAEETGKESTETPPEANGLDVESNAETEINVVGKMEKTAVDLDNETDLGIVVVRRTEESLERESPISATSETPEKESEDAKVSKDEEIRNESVDSTERKHNESSESTPEIRTSEVTLVADDAESAPRKETESTSVVTEVLREVFDLASAEVQKRLNTEKQNDEKLAESIDETLENISLEIQNSADMPSLEPLIDERNAKNQS